MHSQVVTGKWHHFSPVLPWFPAGSDETALTARSWPIGSLPVLVPCLQDAAVPHCALKALIVPVAFFNPNSSKPECLHPFRSHSCRVICTWPLLSHPQRAPLSCLSASHSEMSMWKMHGKGNTGGACANLTHHTLRSHRWKSARWDQVAPGTFQAVGAFQSLWVQLLPNSRRQVGLC